MLNRALTFFIGLVGTLGSLENLMKIVLKNVLLGLTGKVITSFTFIARETCINSMVDKVDNAQRLIACSSFFIDY